MNSVMGFMNDASDMSMVKYRIKIVMMYLIFLQQILNNKLLLILI